MSRATLIIRPSAARDAEGAARWYEEQVPGLGQDFLEAVEATIDRVVDNPLWFPIILRDVRRALLNRFPYAVYFRIRTRKLVVLAVMHLARDPERWQSRR